MELYLKISATCFLFISSYISLSLSSTCSTVGEWGSWGTWSSCSVTCGGGTRMRSAGLCCNTDAHGQWINCTAEYNKPSSGWNYEYSNCGETCVHGMYLAGSGCNCYPGYTDSCCSTDIDECASSPCLNGGTCTGYVNLFTCVCPAGYVGVRCETDVDECASSPCQNGGTCFDMINRFTCNCLPGYTGTRCDIDIDECASFPCKHSGTCLDKINEYTCNCLSGYTGVQCETDIDECESNPCVNGGRCIDNVNGFSCDCLPIIFGHFCEIYILPVVLGFIAVVCMIVVLYLIARYKRERGTEVDVFIFPIAADGVSNVKFVPLKEVAPKNANQ